MFGFLLLLSGVRAAATELRTPPPNLPSQCFKSFAGYLPVAGGSKQLFHWYHEATTSPETKPVVLWLNGGPGCSSLSGMFTELGPYVVDKNQQVTLNPYSWNKVANVLFVEQPAGVGFSYPADKFTNDTITADDTYDALLHFFANHPELKGRKFYVTGESYGGHYVPNVVKAIQNGNAAGKSKINIAGFAVGNGYTDWKLDFNANVENGRFHALTSQTLFDAANEACQGSFARCFWPRDDVDCPKACDDAVQAATVDAEDGSIDIYDIYVDVCLDRQTNLLRKKQTTILMEERMKQIKKNRKHRQLNQGTVISPVFDTCEDDFSTTYLNSEEVRSYLGIRKGTIGRDGNWSGCGGVTYHFNYESEIPNYLQWVEDGELEILIYNGDADYILSHMGNSAWVRSLNLTKTKEWTKWKGSDRQIAGYFEQWKTNGAPLTFLTVKGAGHMVPKDRPQHALDMLTSFLNGGTYDKVDAGPTTDLCPKTTEL